MRDAPERCEIATAVLAKRIALCHGYPVLFFLFLRVTNKNVFRTWEYWRWRFTDINVSFETI